MPQSFHVPQSSLIALWKRQWMPTDSRMSIVWLIGSAIKSKNVRGYRCRALAEWSVPLPIDQELSALCPNVMVSSIETSRMASSIGIIKPGHPSLRLIVFHRSTTRTVWCMSPQLMLWLILISLFDMRMHSLRRISAIAIWISRTYLREIEFEESSMTTQAHQSSKLTKKVVSLTSSWRRASSDSAILHLISQSCLAQPVLCQRQPKANAMPRRINGLRTYLIKLVKWPTPSLRWNLQFPIWVSVASFSANYS